MTQQRRDRKREVVREEGWVPLGGDPLTVGGMGRGGRESFSGSIMRFFALMPWNVCHCDCWLKMVSTTCECYCKI